MVKFLKGRDGWVADLSQQTIRGLSRLSTYSLDSLILVQCDLRDLSLLHILYKATLKKLDVSRNPLKTIFGIEGFNLEEFHGADCQFTDLSPLIGMPLRKIVLDRTPIESFEALRDMPLEHVSLVGVPVQRPKDLLRLFPSGCSVVFE